MKKYVANKLFLLVIFGFIMCLASCKARRSVAQSVVVESTVERVETTTDTSRVSFTAGLNIQTQEEVQDNTFVRTTEFDSTGTVVLRVREEWRDVGRTQLSVLHGQETYISVSESETFVHERDSTTIIKSTVSKTETDSRLMQGRLWIVIVVSLIIIALLMIYARRKWK